MHLSTLGSQRLTDFFAKARASASDKYRFACENVCSKYIHARQKTDSNRFCRNSLLKGNFVNLFTSLL
jgi:hypothetical protein